MEVFYTSPWVPPEWIKAHGLEPRGIWLAKDFAGQPLPLAAGVCAFADVALRLAEREKESAVVFTTHCDQLRRGFDAVVGAASSRTFLFNLPATWQTPVAERIYCDELRRLGRFLIGLGGRETAPGAVRELMSRYNRSRQRLLDAAGSCPARQYAEAVARFYLDGSVTLPAEHDGGAEQVRLAVVGGPLPQSQMPLLDAIEAAGGRVVLNATEAGERSLWTASPPEPANGKEAELLAETYLANCIDVFQRPNTRLFEWLKERLAARQVRGIVLWHYVGCDLWRAEAQPMREAFGLPVLLLEAEDASLQRNTGRLEAFLESLQTSP